MMELAGVGHSSAGDSQKTAQEARELVCAAKRPCHGGLGTLNTSHRAPGPGWQCVAESKPGQSAPEASRNTGGVQGAGDLLHGPPVVLAACGDTVSHHLSGSDDARDPLPYPPPHGGHRGRLSPSRTSSSATGCPSHSVTVTWPHLSLRTGCEQLASLAALPGTVPENSAPLGLVAPLPAESACQDLPRT